MFVVPVSYSLGVNERMEKSIQDIMMREFICTGKKNPKHVQCYCDKRICRNT